MSLPALVYIGDVPVEASYHGSALLYRLFQNYPRERLRIIESTIHSSLPERRLEDIRYDVLDVGSPRWLSTRFHPYVSSFYTRRAPRRCTQVHELLAGFHPQAVISVVHGYSWLPAAKYAESMGLPLHLVIHDDWPRQAQLTRWARNWTDARFGEAYRQSVSRLCVSQQMEETYRERYGAAGSVLYPCRAANAELYDGPPRRVTESNGEVVFGFGGTINSPGYVRALRALADVLQRHGGRLNIYGPIAADDARRAGLQAPNIELRGLVKAERFIETLRTDVDVLFLPLSFDAQDRENMRLCFPSKIADYTAAGLPMLAYGPPDSSGVRWMRDHAGLGEVVDREDGEDLNVAVQRLLSPARRHGMGQCALDAGREDFSHANVEASFYRHLRGGQ